MNSNAIDVMRIALQQYGYKESPPGSNRNKFGKAFGLNGVPYCAEYVWWCGEQPKGDNPIAKSANAADIQRLTVQKKGGKYILQQTADNTKKKKALPKFKFGDNVSFNFNGGSSRMHTGLIVGVSGENVYCIEANTSFSDAGSQSNGGCVALRKRDFRNCVCVVRPKYAKSSFHTPTEPFTGKAPALPTRGYFKYGDDSPQVARLQKALSWANGYKLKADEEFGSNTLAEVCIFQESQGLAPDGQFGSKSLAKLNSLIKKCSGSKEQKTPQKAPEPSVPAENTSADKLVDEPNKVEKISEKVLDISAWQDKVSEADWKKVIKDGITCVILRSSYTKQKEFKMFKDSVFDHNIKTAIKAGMHIGIYHYSQATTEEEAEKEADFCLNVIAPYRKHIDLPVAFDWEFGVRLNPTVAKKNGKTKNSAICTVFCNRVQRAGYDTMVYANLSTLNGYLSTNLPKMWKVWVAQYNKTCDYKQPWYLWQYTSSGSCSGISGKLDVSRFKEVPKKPDAPKPDAPKTDSILPKRGYFKNGDEGANVKEMQKMLNKANEGAYWSIREDGVFGDKTESYVRILEDARHLDIDGKFDEKCLKECEKKVTIQMRAINFAISIVRDNSFAYGTGERAHRYGCYFCKTNTGDRMYKKQKKGEPKYVKDSKGNKHTYEKTYCCNPFITACYAHGAGIKKVLEACRNGSGGGMSPSTWTRYGFKTVGKSAKVDFKDLKKGDILITDKHVCMYTGGDWLTEASGGTWSAKSIAHKKGAKKRFNTYQKNSKSYVMRYVEPVKVSDELKKQLP